MLKRRKKYVSAKLLSKFLSRSSLPKRPEESESFCYPIENEYLYLTSVIRFSLSTYPFPRFFFLIFRDRNRMFARNTRVKKKTQFDTLRQEIFRLKLENENMKSVIRLKLSDVISNQILSGIDKAFMSEEVAGNHLTYAHINFPD